MNWSFPRKRESITVGCAIKIVSWLWAPAFAGTTSRIHVRVRSYAREKILTDNARALLVEGRQPVTLD